MNHRKELLVSRLPYEIDFGCGLGLRLCVKVFEDENEKDLGLRWHLIQPAPFQAKLFSPKMANKWQ
jgi:hypothetical protein